MYDAVFVLVEAFNKIIKKKPDQFRAYTQRRQQQGMNGNGSKILDCNTSKGGLICIFFLKIDKIIFLIINNHWLLQVFLSYLRRKVQIIFTLPLFSEIP